MDTPLIRVLVIADNAAVVGQISEALADGPNADGFQVDSAGSITAGLERYAAEPADVVLLDLPLPDATGHDALGRIVAALPDCPFVLLTDRDEAPIRTGAIQHGAQDTLPKAHLTGALLARTLRYAMERQEMRRELSSRLAELESSESRFRRLIEEEASGVLVVDEVGRALYVNPVAEQLLGVRATDMIGETIGIPIGSDEPTEMDIAGGWDKRTTVEMRVVQTVWQGQQVYLVSLNDITQRKQAEQELRRQLELMSRLTDTSPVGIILIDSRGSITFANHRAEQVLGASREEITSRTFDDDEWQASDFAGNRLSPDQLPFSRVLAERRTVRDIRCTVRLPGDRRVFLSVNAAPIFDDRGRVEQVVMTIEDITSYVESAGALERANAELMQKNAELEQFTYTVSHDLKSPLVTISGFLSHVRKDVAAGRYDRLVDLLGHIDRAAERMSVLIDDLLRLSRVGLIAENLEPLPLDEIVDDLLTLHDHLLAEAEVTVHVGRPLGAVRADRKRLTQALDNLIVNAVKHGRTGDAPRIEIRTCKTDGEVWISVADNGPGIAPEHHDRIFKLFQRLDAGQKGTGIGLAIVRKVAEAHGGRTWVESEPGQGATFYLAFPD